MAKLLCTHLFRLGPALLSLLLVLAPAAQAAPAQNSTAQGSVTQTIERTAPPESSGPTALGAGDSFLRQNNATAAAPHTAASGAAGAAISGRNATSLGSALAGAEESAFSWGGYFKGIGALFLILAALWGVVWFLRRRGSLPGMGGLPRGQFSIEAQLALSPKKKLILVRFLNSRLLLGVTDQQITLLKEVGEPDGREESTKSTARDFAEVIKNASQKNDAS